MATDQQINYDVPVSTLLRIETAAAHSAAETSAGAGYLVRGQLDKQEYVRFLMMLWHVYSALEQGLERHATHPVLQPTYNPTLFARASALSSDISTLLGVPELEWPSHSVNQTLLSSPPAAFSAYISRLNELADSSDPSPLLAHSYIRYLGDLSGGQFIARAVSKAYNLDHPDKLGVKFYQFSQLGGGGPASTNADTKKIKDWFRKGMDEGVADNVPRKEALLEETNQAYRFNAGLFDTLQPPETQPTAENTVAQREMPIEIVQNNAASRGNFLSQAWNELSNKLVSVDSVLSVVLAVGLGHFLLVVGGFTSSRWYAKVATFEQFMNGNETAVEVLSRWWTGAASA